MSLFKLSPNEVERLLNDERNKRKKERIKQVREQSKVQSRNIIKNVQNETKRLEELTTNGMKNKWSEEHSKKILKAEENLQNTLMEIGESHRNAIELNIDHLNEQKSLKAKENQCVALKRQNKAIETLREDREILESQRIQPLVDRCSALEMEKVRSSMIASLPKPKPKPEQSPEPLKPKTYSSKVVANSNIIIEKENIDASFPRRSASEEAEIYEQRFESMEERKQRIIEERRSKSLLRYKEALDKEHHFKEQQNLLHSLDDTRKEEISAKILEVEKFSKQALMKNLRQKADKRVTTKHLQSQDVEEEIAGHLPSNDEENDDDDDRTSELCHVSLSTPSEDGRATPSESRCQINNSEIIQVDVTASLKVKPQDAAMSLQPQDVDSQQDDQQKLLIPSFWHKVDEYSKRRLVELVERQKLEAAMSKLQNPSLQAEKVDVPLQVNVPLHVDVPIQVDANTTRSFTMLSKHETTRVASEELETNKAAVQGSHFETHDVMEIRKKKQELLSELMAIEQELTEVMDSSTDNHHHHHHMMEHDSTQNDSLRSSLEIQNTAVISSRIPSIHRPDDDSFMSSTSTQYLDLPINQILLDSATMSCLELYESDTSQADIGMMMASLRRPTSHLHPSQSQNNSTDTEYMEIPNSKKQKSIESFSGSSLRSSYIELPSTRCKTVPKPLANTHSTSRIQPLNYILMGGGDGVPMQSKPPRASSNSNNMAEMNYPVENNFVSDNPHNSFDVIDFFPHHHQSSLDNSTATDLSSEKASFISFEILNSEAESTRLSSGYENIHINQCNKKISTFFDFYSSNLNLPDVGNSISSRHYINSSSTSNVAINGFQDFNNQMMSQCADETVDLNSSEKVSCISIEHLDHETESTRMSSDRKNSPKNGNNWKAAVVFHSDHSSDRETHDESVSSKTILGDVLQDVNDVNNKDCDDEILKSSQLPRNWGKILEPYMKTSEPKSQSATISLVESGDDDDCSHDDHHDSTISCQIAETGILEEPNLTLVSADTSLSATCDSLLNSGLISSSLLSFERHENNFLQDIAINQSSIDFIHFEEVQLKESETIPHSLQGGNAFCALETSVTSLDSRTKPDLQKNPLMYPDENVIKNSLKETLSSWKKSRITK